MSIKVEIENVSGIRSGSAVIERGVNAVKASNWQGKTSLIDALEVGMGTKKTLTEGASRGHVTLNVESSEYQVDLRRDGTEVVKSGASYLASEYDRVRGELFAFLGEDNPVRRAVRDGENLEQYLTRPLEFENIDDRISDLQTEREQVRRELDSTREAAEELPRVIEKIESHETDLESIRDRLADIDGERGDTLESKRTELSELRAKRDHTETKIERLENSIERATAQLESKRDELASLEVPDESDIDAELADERTELSDVERDVELLRSVYEANERVLDENRQGLVTDVEHDVLGDTVTCWVCGSAAEHDAFEARLEALRERIRTLQDRAATHRDRVAELEERREKIAAAERRRNELNAEIIDLKQRVTERRESLESAEQSRASIEDRLENLERTVETTDDERTDLESELKYVETELEELRERRERLEARAGRREQLAREREQLTEEIEALRERKESVKRELRETFDAAIDDVVGRFETGFETARLTSTFDLVVARDGREADLQALSEGERELLGIVVALAGYRTFDVDTDVPVLLLDGLGGLADENIRRLVEFLEPHTRYLVLTAYPEHTRFEGHEIDPTEWTVVSRELAES